MTTNKSLQMSVKINEFINKLGLPMEMSRVLFETFKDCELFFKSFYIRNQYVFDDLLDFREYKIKESEITLDLFVDECYNKGMKESFESTFFQPFDNSDLVLVEKAIIELRTSIPQLFLDFQKNPNRNILKSVL